MLAFVKSTLNQTAGHPFLTAAILYSTKASFHETSGHPVILYALLILVLVHTIAVNISSFKRDVRKKTFNTVYDAASLLSNPDSVLSRDSVKDSIITYETLYAGARQQTGRSSTNDSIQKRAKEYQTMVDSFYNLVTDFYEWGWGQVCKKSSETITAQLVWSNCRVLFRQSFHFAPRKVGETFNESIVRAEHYIALRANIQPGFKVLDVGCGVGGPMRNIAQFTGADVTGITINQYQVKVGNQYCEQKGMDKMCRIYQGDFQCLPRQFAAATFDAAYAIEATCHSPNRKLVFQGIHHCIKKGGLFVAIEWALLPEYNEKNPDHVRIKEGIEIGNGLPTLVTVQTIVEDLEDSGFEVLDVFDTNRGMHSEYEIPWYHTLCGSFTLKGFRMTRLGRNCTHAMVTCLEFFRVLPKGSARVSALLNAAALDLVEAGKKGIFTPCLFILAKKQ
jgi:sterol 24-C-methyltransferase